LDHGIILALKSDGQDGVTVRRWRLRGHHACMHACAHTCQD